MMKGGKHNLVRYLDTFFFSSTSNLKGTDDGSCNEIYTGRAPDCVIGLTFVEAALVSSFFFL